MAVKISGMVSGLDTDSIVKELVSAYSTKKDNYTKDQTKLSWTMESWKNMNTKIYSFYSKSLSNMRYSSSFSGMKKTTVSDETKASVTADSTVTNGTQTLEINKLATAGYLTGAKLASSETITNKTTLGSLGVTGSTTLTLNVSGKEKTFDISNSMTVEGFSTELSKVGLVAKFDTTQQRFIINSKESGKDNDFNFTVKGADDLAALTSLGLTVASGGFKQGAENSIIKLNGATFETASNNITVNGLTINAKGLTDGQISMTTETDVDGIYNMVKDFITGYNELVNSMDSAYNADASTGYAPLTTDEKAKMTDTEVEKWETKIKDSLLRRDSTLDSVSGLIKNSMQASYTVDVKSYSLSSFGITTLGYFSSAANEKNALHIDGNKDDTTTSSNTDKLRAAIESNPDVVTGFFTELAKNAYDKLSEKMKSTTLNSAYKVYNDKKMQEDYDSFGDKIDESETKIKDMEDYYNKKFSDMETALSKIKTSTSSLSSLLGSSSNA